MENISVVVQRGICYCISFCNRRHSYYDESRYQHKYPLQSLSAHDGINVKVRKNIIISARGGLQRMHFLSTSFNRNTHCIHSPARAMGNWIRDWSARHRTFDSRMDHTSLYNWIADSVHIINHPFHIGVRVTSRRLGEVRRRSLLRDFVSVAPRHPVKYPTMVRWHNQRQRCLSDLITDCLSEIPIVFPHSYSLVSSQIEHVDATFG